MNLFYFPRHWHILPFPPPIELWPFCRDHASLFELAAGQVGLSSPSFYAYSLSNPLLRFQVHNLILMVPGPSRSKYSCVEGCNSESFNGTGPLQQHQKVCQVYIASKKGNVAIRSRALADYTVARTERVNRRANLLVCISYPTYDHTYNALYDTPGHRQT